MVLAEKNADDISREKIMLDYAPKPFYDAVKRVFDIVCSSLALVVLSPLFLAVIIAVKSDGGRAFYSQLRVGKNGKMFRMYKFRSMVENADELLEDLLDKNDYKDGPAFKMKEDPRVTKVGHFIRKYSIDELPQLINIIKGDMSIVGPRPPLPREVVQYDDYQRQRLLVTPGLTCYWQTYGRSGLPFNDWMIMDIHYIQRRCFTLDLHLILKTIYAVIFTRGAY